MKVLIEDVKDTIALYAERLTTLDDRDARQHAEHRGRQGAIAA